MKIIKNKEKERIGAPAREARGGPRGPAGPPPLFLFVFYYFQIFSFVFRGGCGQKNSGGAAFRKIDLCKGVPSNRKTERCNAFAKSIFMEPSPPWNAAPPVIGVLRFFKWKEGPGSATRGSGAASQRCVFFCAGGEPALNSHSKPWNDAEMIPE